MDVTQKQDVRALRGVLSRIDRAGKCVPCRIVFSVSCLIFLAVVSYLFFTNIQEDSALQPIAPELIQTLTPEQYAEELLRLEAVFDDPRSSSLFTPTSPTPVEIAQPIVSSDELSAPTQKQQ